MRLHKVERSGSGRAKSSLQTPPPRLKGLDKGSQQLQNSRNCLHEHHIGDREISELTDWLRNSHDLRAVKRQIAQRPDDRMDLLHYVERDCNDATCVLTHSHTPAKTIQNIPWLTKDLKWKKKGFDKMD